MAGTIHRYGAALEWRRNQGNGTRRFLHFPVGHRASVSVEAAETTVAASERTS